MIDTFLKTLKLLGVFCLGSLGFAFIVNGVVTTGPKYGDEWVGVLFLIMLALVLEIWIYKKFYKKWRIVFLNYMITHFAAFFAMIPCFFLFLAGYADQVGIVFLGIWFPIAYFSVSQLDYFKRLELKVKEQQAQIDGFTDQKVKILKQIETMKARLDNQRRYGK
ncbi:hypothetical protein FEK30_13330 [Picosynechococcus sp. PCC 11901]|uniref:hypothetical protein n=1 Tax=Picosynechococcus sp. PCC 11901 TaxID=2579791 RepID=UPI0010FBFC7D|nr:hypothetical protein [Picosynechococcus sp. PCC 11901]QCS50325.1 hypothetical protein FEK30_13330 [Picosynechococcus sp. PCC 11901]